MEKKIEYAERRIRMGKRGRARLGSSIESIKRRDGDEDDKKGRKMDWAGDSNSNSVNDKKIPMRYFRPFFRSPSVEFNLILIGGDDRVGRTTEGESSAGAEKTDAVQQ